MTTARDELEAVIWERWPRGAPGAAGAVDAILAAADRYRDAPGDRGPVPLPGLPMHLDGSPRDMHTACRRSWGEPGMTPVTDDPAGVTCPKCLRSLLYRAVAGEAGTT